MVAPVRHIISWSLIGVLLFGQTGVSLHQIYCFCKGEWESSLFAEKPDCSSHEEKTVASIPSCCSHSSDCHGNSPGINALPCSTDQVIYLQLDQAAIPSMQQVKGSIALSWTLVHHPLFLKIDPLRDAHQDQPPAEISPPGLKDGRLIRTWVQSFLC